MSLLFFANYVCVRNGRVYAVSESGHVHSCFKRAELSPQRLTYIRLGGWGGVCMWQAASKR